MQLHHRRPNRSLQTNSDNQQHKHQYQLQPHLLLDNSNNHSKATQQLFRVHKQRQILRRQTTIMPNNMEHAAVSLRMEAEMEADWVEEGHRRSTFCCRRWKASKIRSTSASASSTAATITSTAEAALRLLVLKEAPRRRSKPLFLTLWQRVLRSEVKPLHVPVLFHLLQCNRVVSRVRVKKKMITAIGEIWRSGKRRKERRKQR